jgi:hydroxycarboxylate dehydrogenase B
MNSMDKADGSLRIKVEPLSRLIQAIFQSAGCEDDESERIARHLIDANLTGHDSHGVIRTGRYVQWIGEGKVIPGKHLRILNETDVMAMVDGQQGFGQTVGREATQLGMAKAAEAGIAVIALRNSGHLGRIGAWAEMAAKANQVSVHFVNVRSSLLVAPFGGVERRMSTAPFTVGVPVPGEDPIILDFATSAVAEGKALVSFKGGKPLPPNVLIGADGGHTNDPSVLYGPQEEGKFPNPLNGPGALRAMGDHKGSGLAFMCELLAGAFTGSGCAGPPPRPFANGMLSIYMNVDVFHSDNGFADEVRQYVDFFRSSKAEADDGTVMIPGDPERKARHERLEKGVLFSADTWESILATAATVGLDAGKTDQILSGT